MRDHLQITQISFKLIVGLLIFLGLSVLIGKSISGYQNKYVIDEINKYVIEAKSQNRLPIQLDSLTTLVDINASSNMLTYHYTISGSLNTEDYEILQDRLIEDTCRNENLNRLLEIGVRIDFEYTEDSTHKVTLLSVQQDECK